MLPQVVLQRLLAIVLCSALVGCASGPYQKGKQADVAAVRQVVEAFRVAILRKDKAAYMRLFFSGRGGGQITGSRSAHIGEPDRGAWSMRSRG